MDLGTVEIAERLPPKAKVTHSNRVGFTDFSNNFSCLKRDALRLTSRRSKLQPHCNQQKLLTPLWISSCRKMVVDLNGGPGVLRF